MLPNWTRVLDLFERGVMAIERLAAATEARNRILSGALRDEAEDARPVEVSNGHAPRER